MTCAIHISHVIEPWQAPLRISRLVKIYLLDAVCKAPIIPLQQIHALQNRHVICLIYEFVK